MSQQGTPVQAGPSQQTPPVRPTGATSSGTPPSRQSEGDVRIVCIPDYDFKSRALNGEESTDVGTKFQYWMDDAADEVKGIWQRILAGMYHA